MHTNGKHYAQVLTHCFQRRNNDNICKILLIKIASVQFLLTLLSVASCGCLCILPQRSVHKDCGIRFSE